MSECLYVYDCHLGNGYYVTDEEIEDLYCEVCGDSDTLVYCGTKENIIKQLQEELDTAKNSTDLCDKEYQIECAESELEYVREIMKKYGE